MQLSKWRECQAQGCLKASFSVRKVAKCNFKSTLKYMKDVSFHEMKCYLHAEDRFSCLELFLRAKNTNAVRAKNTNAVFSATKQMKRMQGQGCWKASFSVRERCLNSFLRLKLNYMKDVFFFMKWNVICNRRQIFVFRAFLQSKSC